MKNLHNLAIRLHVDQTLSVKNEMMLAHVLVYLNTSVTLMLVVSLSACPTTIAHVKRLVSETNAKTLALEFAELMHSARLLIIIHHVPVLRDTLEIL